MNIFLHFDFFTENCKTNSTTMHKNSMLKFGDVGHLCAHKVEMDLAGPLALWKSISITITQDTDCVCVFDSCEADIQNDRPPIRVKSGGGGNLFSHSFSNIIEMLTMSQIN